MTGSNQQQLPAISVTQGLAATWTGESLLVVTTFCSDGSSEHPQMSLASRATLSGSEWKVKNVSCFCHPASLRMHKRPQKYANGVWCETNRWHVCVINPAQVLQDSQCPSTALQWQVLLSTGGSWAFYAHFMIPTVSCLVYKCCIKSERWPAL